MIPEFDRHIHGIFHRQGTCASAAAPGQSGSKKKRGQVSPVSAGLQTFFTNQKTNTLISLYMKKLETFLKDNQLIPPLQAHEQLPLYGHQFALDDQAYFLGPTWMDDLAVCFSTTSARELVGTASHVCSHLLDLCAYHCVTPNLSKGKTELQLTFRGNGSRELKVQYYGPHASGELPILCERGMHMIQLVTQYKHLGSIVHHSSDQRAEIRQRAAIAHGTLSQFGKQLFRNHDIQFDKRAELFQMLVMTKFLYGAESWIAIDARTQKAYHSTVMRLYKRLGCIQPAERLSDDAILVRVAQLSPEELLRRTRLRYLSTLVHVKLTDIWAVLALDDAWRSLLEDDLVWMWSQLKRASHLTDPRENYPQWLILIQTSPRYWKRLINRACAHAISQRKKVQQVRDFHQSALDRLWTQLPIDDRPKICQTKQQPAVFGCFACGDCFCSKAGEAAHMFKKHGQASKLRSLFDQPSCPACLKYYHTLLKLKAHLHYSKSCRDQLHSMNIECAVMPGSGSVEDQQREQQHDRFLPPLCGYGPCPEPRRAREAVDIDDHVYGVLVDTLIEAQHVESFKSEIERFVMQYPISWTRWRSTVSFFKNHMEIADAKALNFDFKAIQEILDKFGDAEHWGFLSTQKNSSREAKEINELHDECRHLRQWLELHTPEPAPSAFGRIRIVLHAYSGRRRRGDIQFFLDRLAEQQNGFVLMVVSMDIIINKQYGDATNQHTCEYWVQATRRKWVIACIAGPPCETWSCARGAPLPGADAEEGPNNHGPRILRDIEELWGFDALTLRELRQICVGNALLCFALRMIIELIITNGFALLEHPAEPLDDGLKASIWRLPLVKALELFPNVEIIRFAQGLMGTSSPKPTNLLLVNLPLLLQDLHAGRVRTELPRTSAIGRSSDGTWRTSALKEYAPAMCRSIAISLFRALQQSPLAEAAEEPLPAFLQLCQSLVQTDYGESMGADYAGS